MYDIEDMDAQAIYHDLSIKAYCSIWSVHRLNEEKGSNVLFRENRMILPNENGDQG